MSMGSMYRHCQRSSAWRGQSGAVRKSGSLEQLGRPEFHCRSTEPPPAAAYDAWLEKVRSADPRCRAKITGEKLRRAVRMIRNGYSKSEAYRAINVKSCSTRDWIKRLPPELAP